MKNKVKDKEISMTKEVKKPAKKVEPIKEPNFKDFAGLVKEFNGNKMPERKRIALKTRLIKLYNADVLETEERDFLMLMLRRSRGMATISSVEGYLLHKEEMEECEDVCYIATDDAPLVLHLDQKGLECRFKQDVERNRFIVYVPKTVPTSHQLQPETVRKQNMGHPTEPSEFPAPRILIKMLNLKPVEFHSWFKIADENILDYDAHEEAQEAASYQF